MANLFKTSLSIFYRVGYKSNKYIKNKIIGNSQELIAIEWCQSFVIRILILFCSKITKPQCVERLKAKKSVLYKSVYYE